MAFTPFARYRNFTLANLKSLLEVYPDMAKSVSWDDAKDFAEENLKGYKRTAYQQACQFGLEDRSTQTFRLHNYLYTFDDENLFRYLVFWFKTYFVPNPYVNSDDEPFLLYCRICEDILQSEKHSVSFEKFVEKNIGGKSDDIFLNAIKAYGSPIKYQKIGNDNILYISSEDVDFVKSEISFIKANFPIAGAKSEHNFFERFSYKNFCKFYNETANPTVKDGEKFAFEESKGQIDNDPVDDFKSDLIPPLFHNAFSFRYITSLIAKPFVILTGNSGTGKTRIARLFSKYLEVKLENDEKNWLIVPVGADWTDNIKVLGFYNPLADNGKGKYEKTKILELIERANQNPDIPFFLVLDEMNLSHVERYFSDFLSHMERKDSIFELDGYEGKLSYPDNLFVVGTVNIDETTYMFSPKVLDRANVIEFKPDKKDVMNLFDAEPEKAEIAPAGDDIAAAFLKLSKEIRNGKSDVMNDPSVAASDKVTEIFSKLYDITEKQGFEFAFRTVREIKQYITAAYELQEDKSMFDLDKTIDEQIVQKILPKIHGNKKEIGELLAELKALCPEDKMPLSYNKIDQMERKLSTVQYASFI